MGWPHHRSLSAVVPCVQTAADANTCLPGGRRTGQGLGPRLWGAKDISKRQVSPRCEEIDGKVKAFLKRPIEGDWPYPWIDATSLKVRRGGRFVSVAVIIAIRVNPDGRREVPGLEICISEGGVDLDRVPAPADPPRPRAGLLAVSEAHEGIKAAVSKALGATWQRCRVHFRRNAVAHAGKSGRRAVSAFIATAFAQEAAEAASLRWRSVADQVRPKVPKLVSMMDEAEHDVLAYMSVPREHLAKLHSTERQEQASHRALWDLPKRRRHHPPRRRLAAGAER